MLAVSAGVVIAVSALGSSGKPGPGGAAAAASAVLQPSAGQYFPVPGVKALDTRDGTSGVPAARLAPGATMLVPVTGIGAVPGSGVTGVFAVITAVDPTRPGALEDYNTDVPDPGIWTVPFGAHQQASGSDLVPVSGSGDISVTNASAGSTDVEVLVLGYVQGDYYLSGAGDRYATVPYTAILDAHSSVGAPMARVPADGSLTIQVAGRNGIPSDAAGVALYIGTANASQDGWISAFPAGTPDPALPIVSYSEGPAVRNLYLGALSPSGRLTLVNHGSAPVDMTATAQGYLIGPAGTGDGDTWNNVSPARIADTRYGTGGVPALPVPAGGSITFAATGLDGVPVTGTPAVTETVTAANPTASGFLSVSSAGIGGSRSPAVNFRANDSHQGDTTASLISPLSPTGRQTIVNHSGGTVEVIVSISGYYIAPTVPRPPDSVYVEQPLKSRTSATITWRPPYGDGGSPVTSYRVTAPPDRAVVTVGPETYRATLTGLKDALADDFTVTASNAVGHSTGADDEYMTVNPDSQVMEQDVGVTFNESMGTETLVDSGANIITGRANGATVVTHVKPQVRTYFENDDATAALMPRNSPAVTVGCHLHIKRSKHARINFLGSFDNGYKNGNSWDIAWFNKAWSIDDANIDPGTKTAQWEAVVCSSGTGTTFPGSGYKAVLSETSVMANSVHQYNLDDGTYGKAVTSSDQVTSSENFSLGGQYAGANISVSGGVTVGSDVINSELNGFVGGADGHYGLAFPKTLLSYYETRVNAEWEAYNASGRLSSSVGNEALGTYVWTQTKHPDHTFYNVVIFSTCRHGLCGFAYANSTQARS